MSDASDDMFAIGVDLAEAGRLHEARRVFNRILKVENRKHNAWRRVVRTRAMIRTALRVVTGHDRE